MKCRFKRQLVSGGCYRILSCPSRQLVTAGNCRPKAVIDQTTKKPAEAGLIAGI